MREYSPEELDVMAEAYFLVQDKVPHQRPSTGRPRFAWSMKSAWMSLAGSMTRTLWLKQH